MVEESHIISNQAEAPVKRILLTLISLASLSTYAGAYGFRCSNSSASLKISQDTVSLNNYFIGNEMIESEKRHFTSKSLITVFGDTENDSGKESLKIEVSGKIKKLSSTFKKLPCDGATRSVEIYSAKVTIQNLTEKPISEFLICESSVETGHCVSDE